VASTTYRTLEPDELARLIGQDVGLAWLLPLAVEILRDEALKQPAGGFIDGDLLYAAVTRSSEVWRTHPELAHELKNAVTLLTDLSTYEEREVEAFLASLPEEL
jgi:hypothetical protein